MIKQHGFEQVHGLHVKHIWFDTSENMHRAAEIHYVLKMHKFWAQHNEATFWGQGAPRTSERALLAQKSGHENQMHFITNNQKQWSRNVKC